MAGFVDLQYEKNSFTTGKKSTSVKALRHSIMSIFVWRNSIESTFIWMNIGRVARLRVMCLSCGNSATTLPTKK